MLFVILFIGGLCFLAGVGARELLRMIAKGVD